MITSQKAEKLSDKEREQIENIEKVIDRQIKAVFKNATTSSVTHNFNIYGHRDSIPARFVRELIRRYSSNWNVSYVSPEHDIYGHTSSGYFMFAKKQGEQK